MRMARSLVDEIVAHARQDLPNECCGIVSTDDGRAVRVYRARNQHQSPLRFEIDSRDLIRIYSEIEDAGHDLGAMYHSHTESPAYPSQTDVNFGQDWPGLIWLIVSLADRDAPELKAYRITGPDVQEVQITVE